MSENTSLYDTDFVLWSMQQAEAPRAAARGATNQPIDWENVAEEIDSLARSEKRELGSQIRRVIEHLLMLEYSAADGPRRRWVESIIDARSEIEDVFDDSPSLRTQIEAVIATAVKRGARKAIFDLEKYGELDPATTARIRAASYTEDRVLGDWFPPQPGAE
jgi:hypothetical protein